MIEFTAISSAHRHRSLQDALRRVDQQRADMAQALQAAFNESRRRQQIIAQRVELDAQRLRDRRNDIEFETTTQQTLDEQRRIRDTIFNDTLFQLNQIAIRDDVNASRQSRKAQKVLLYLE